MTIKSWKKERAYRVLRMYELLQSGAGIEKSRIAELFHVSEKSVQRDLDLLKQYLGEYYEPANEKVIKYSKKKNRYFWENRNNIFLKQEEIMLLATILLESRAISKVELEGVLNKMLLQCGADEAKRIAELIRNEVYHYIPVKHGKDVGNLIWNLSEAKEKQLVVEIEYKKVKAEYSSTVRVIPLGIMFSEMYFYLLAYNEDDLSEQRLITYRIDRIEGYRILHNQHFKISYSERFQEGEFRQQVQFMSTGKLMNVKFRFWGKSLEAVLDRLPNAKIIEQNEQDTVLTAQVFGKGIKMWFLSQAEFLEVIEPYDFREEMKESIRCMMNNYDK